MTYIKNTKISKIAEIEKLIKCPCGKGNIEVITIFVSPNNGKVSLSYKYCTNTLCTHRKGILILTDIVIPELILEKEKYLETSKKINYEPNNRKRI